jgi:hypothetical protein
MSMSPGGGTGFSTILTDIYNTGKDIFLEKQRSDLAIERQAKAIQGKKVLQEAQAARERAEAKSTTSNLVFIGGGLVILALFVTIVKSI